jgi:hypothetical protein
MACERRLASTIHTSVYRNGAQHTFRGRSPAAACEFLASAAGNVRAWEGRGHISNRVVPAVEEAGVNALDRASASRVLRSEPYQMIKQPLAGAHDALCLSLIACYTDSPYGVTMGAAVSELASLQCHSERSRPEGEIR